MLNNNLPPFHLAVPVSNLDEARVFYGEILGLPQGRSSDMWIDWNMAGHQLVTHLAPPIESDSNLVDGHKVPAFHFGLVLDYDSWEKLAERLKVHNVPFLMEPNVRFAGQAGEQGTFFVRDPAGNALEFKCFMDPSQLFATD